MSARFVVVLALLAPAMALSIQGASKLSFDMEDAKNRPVSKVINLLKDMQKTLEAEAKADEEVYDQLACWCETNDKDKSKAIADAEAKINALNIAIEELTAASTRLQAEIKALETEVTKLQSALDKATAMRQKELAEFNTEEKDLLQSISALKAAIVVIGKHHSAALLQGETSEQKILQVTSVIQHEMQKHGSLLQGVLTRTQKKIISSFVQAPESFFLQQKQAPSAGSYAPASGEILGILKQMRETFESNLSQGQKEELKNSEDYENLKAAKEQEIAAAQDQIETKTQELATTDEKLAIAKTDLEDTTNSLTADQKFLANLRAQCQTIDSEWEARQKTRTEEIAAVGKALEILSGDDAHDLFTKTFNFVQQRQSTLKSKIREQASKLLAEVARKNNNPKLVTLALQIRLDAFTKVKKAIDDMIAELGKEQADEVKHKDFCVKELNANQRSTENKEREKQTLEQTIDDLTMSIDDLTSSLATLKAEIKEMQFQMKRAGEDREKENVEFQGTVNDQRATQKLLQQALEVLKGFYDKKAALVQKQTPPGGFKAYKKNESSGGVMGMIQTIINDAKAAENEAILAESDAQKAYESFVKDTNASISEKSTDITNKEIAKAKAEVEKTRSEESLEKVKLDLDGLSSESADLHQSCDFTLKNFEIRQTARLQEIEALKQVKAILSGAKFSEFLQSDAFADDGSSVVGAQTQQDNEDPNFDPLQAYIDN